MILLLLRNRFIFYKAYILYKDKIKYIKESSAYVNYLKRKVCVMNVWKRVICSKSNHRSGKSKVCESIVLNQTDFLSPYEFDQFFF